MALDLTITQDKARAQWRAAWALLDPLERWRIAVHCFVLDFDVAGAVLRDA